MPPHKRSAAEQDGADDEMATATVIPEGATARAKRLAALKQAIEGGTYKVPASAIADKLIRTMSKAPKE